MTDCLLLADRGYPSVPYFEAVRADGGSFIVRLTRSHDPWVGAAWVEGERVAVPTRTGYPASSRGTRAGLTLVEPA